jgi:transcriptional regulator with XRE-family HTH domain
MPAAPSLPAPLVEVLAAGRVADPAAGQLWQLEWGGRVAVGLVVDVDADPEVDALSVVPAEDDPDLGDAWTLLLDEADSPVGLGFALWTGLTTAVPTRTLNVLLGDIPQSVMARVDQALAVRAAGQPGASGGIGAPVLSILDERAQLAETIKERFADLAAVTWLPAPADGMADVGELLRAAGVQATEVADRLGLPAREVLKLVRNQRPVSPDEIEPLAGLLGVASDILGATVSIPGELAAALDRPRRRPQLRALAEAAGMSEAAFRWTEALAILPMAARQTGAFDAQPGWEQLVEDRLHGR